MGDEIEAFFSKGSGNVERFLGNEWDLHQKGNS